MEKEKSKKYPNDFTKNRKSKMKKAVPKTKKRTYKFEDLMSKVTKENINKFDWGMPKGKEI